MGTEALAQHGLGITTTYPVWFPVAMRAAPTISATIATAFETSSTGVQNQCPYGFQFYMVYQGSGSPYFHAYWSSYTASAEL
jgi:hypothetical protein